MPTASPDVGEKWPGVKTELCNKGFGTHSIGHFCSFFERMIVTQWVCNLPEGYLMENNIFLFNFFNVFR